MQQIGRYRVLRELGRGGMGVVYLALDPAIGRNVAVKTIRVGDLAAPEERQWLEDHLLREARSAGILSHPNIVTIYDVGQEGETTYIVMEYVKGTTLAALLAGESPPEAGLVLSVLRQTASALDYAHSSGVIHRDIKPGNLILHESGTVKIADFGVAKLTATLHLTRSGFVAGTPSYVAPEQVRGEPVSGRADQYSLAVLAFEMFTGQRPFEGDTLSLLYRIAHESPARPQDLNPSLGREVETVLHVALSKNPEERFLTCEEFVEALEAALAASPGWRPVVIPRSRRAPAAPEVAMAPLLGGGAGRFPPTPTPTPTPATPDVACALVCPSCRQPLVKGAKFCYRCGTAVTPAAPVTPEIPRAEAPRAGARGRVPQRGPSRRRAILLAAIAVVAAMAGLVGTLRYLSAGRVSQPPAAPLPEPEASQPPPAPVVSPAPEAQAPPLKPPAERAESERVPRLRSTPKLEPTVSRAIPARRFTPPSQSAPRAQPRVEPPPAELSIAASLAGTQALPAQTRLEEPAAGLPPPPPAAVAETPLAPASRAATSGQLVWQGELAADQVLIIEEGHASQGSLTGQLPGTPVKVEVEPAGVRVITAPGPKNGWKLLVLHSGDEKRTRVVIRWAVTAE